MESVPNKPKEKVFTNEEYAKLETLTAQEKGKEKRVMKKFVNSLKKEKLNQRKK